MRQFEFYGLPVVDVNMLATMSVMESMESQGQTNTELYRALKRTLEMVRRRSQASKNRSLGNI